MAHPGEFVTEPFEFKDGGILTVQTRENPAYPCGAVEFRLEGSKDKTHWTELLSGAASTGEVRQVACRDRVAPWGRVRILSSGPEARVSVRLFRSGKGKKAPDARPAARRRRRARRGRA